MRKSKAIFWILSAVFLSIVVLYRVNSSKAEENKKQTAMLRHIVMFKFNDDSSQEAIETVVDSFAALPSKIPEIIGFEYGENNSPEGLNDGFTHCFTVTFADEKGREVYLPHPAHKEFVEILKPHLDKVLVIDYTTEI